MFQAEVSKTELLQRLQDNRAEHGRRFEQVMDLFWEREAAWLRAQLARVEQRDPTYLRVSKLSRYRGTRRNPRRRARSKFRRAPRPQRPFHFLEDYDSAIAMVEADARDTIQLDPMTFRSLWENNWEMSDEFERQFDTSANEDEED